MDIESSRPHKWPQLLDMTKEECQKSLRALELSAYSQTISVLRAQGELTKEKKKLLNDLQNIFSINLERHRAEIRRAVNDEKLNTIAETLAGPNTGVEWAVEGRRLIPLMPRVPPQTAYTALATRMALLYYNMNSKMPPPSATAHYGKMDDLGCESDATDSDEETDGLRFISGSMVPPQYNVDQGLYTTLPQSQARIARISSKENRENREAPTTTASGISSGPMSVGPMAVGSIGSDKRKRKRSLSTDHPLPPPPQPATREQPSTPSTPTKPQIGGISRPVAGPPMKITVTGNVTRGTPGTPVSTLGGHTQKVILVSTSGASGVGGNMYQRSLSVPVMKGGPGAPPTVMRGVPAGPGPIPSSQMQAGSSMGSSNLMVPTTYASGGQSASGGGLPQSVMPPGTYVNRMRPRVPSGNLPPRPRQRSNSLVLHTEPTIPQRGVEASSGSGSGSLASGSHMSSVPGYSGAPPGIIGSSAPSSHNVPPGHLMTHQTIQVRPGAPVTPGKAAIQIRQEGTGAKIITHTVGGSGSGIVGPGSIANAGGSSNTGVMSSNTPSRLMGRPPLLPPNSPQGTGGPLYVVTTNSGTITVVTRTVAAGQGTGPRVVTVNTINTPKSSVGGVRATSPATVVSVGPKSVQTVRVTPQVPAGLRPVLGGAKSNVIVVHKGAPPGTRPVGLQGIRDVPTKITIGKTLSGNANTAVLQKPPPVPRGAVSSSSVVTSSPATSQGNVIVVDMSGAEANSVNNSNSLADILQATATGSSSVTSTSTSSTNASANVNAASTTAMSARSLAGSVTSASAVSAGSGSSEKNITSGSGGSGVSGSGGEGDNEWLNLGLESGDSPGQSLPEGQMQMLEEAVEILGRGDKESARNLLRQAGIELLDSPGDIVEQGGEAASMASLISGLSSQLPGGHIDGSAVPPVGELDPATGLFYNPSSTESSSDSNSNSASDDNEAEERESPE